MSYRGAVRPLGRDEEISVYRLAEILTDGWAWVAGFLIVALGGASFYLLLRTPTYVASFQATQAESASFAKLNVLPGFSVSPGRAYQMFIDRLGSFQNFESFYEANNEAFKRNEDVPLDVLFAERLSVRIDRLKKGSPKILKVKYTYPEGELGSDILNKYVDFTGAQVWNELKLMFNSQNKAQMALLNAQLSLFEGKEVARRKQHVYDLNKNIETARLLGIAKPTTPQEFGRLDHDKDVVYTTLMDNNALPLYFLGYETLVAQRDILEARLNEGLNTDEVRNLRKELGTRQRMGDLVNGEQGPLDNFRINDANLRVVGIIERAYAAKDPKDLRAAIVLALALCLGVGLGAVASFASAGYKGLQRYYLQKLSQPLPSQGVMAAGRSATGRQGAGESPDSYVNNL